MKIVALLLIAGFLFTISCNGSEENTEVNVINTEAEKKSVEENSETVGLASVSLGEKMFILCEACHSLKEGEAHKTGPNLHQIFGSKVADRDGFEYSDALQGSAVVWNKENMRKWIDNPMEFIPNSNMAFVGVKKKKQQDALIDFLMEQTK